MRQWNFHERTLKTHPYYYYRDVTLFDDIEVVEWCQTMFGPWDQNDDHKSRWLTTFNGYYFKYEKDYILTVLRWS